MRCAFRFTSVGSRLNLSMALFRSLIASLLVSENHGLLKRFGTAEVLGIVLEDGSKKDMGSSASFMAD